jgi:hypothetical protein
LIRLTLAIGDYDHVRDVAEGGVSAEGVEVTVLRLPPEAIFARFSARGEWEASEFSLALYTSLVGHAGEGALRHLSPSGLQATNAWGRPGR